MIRALFLPQKQQLCEYAGSDYGCHGKSALESEDAAVEPFAGIILRKMQQRSRNRNAADL